MATIRSSSLSRAVQTSPKAPTPMRSTSSKRPSVFRTGRLPADRLIGQQIERAAAAGTGQILQLVVIDHFDRIAAVRTADVHGLVLASGRCASSLFAPQMHWQQRCSLWRCDWSYHCLSIRGQRMKIHDYPDFSTLRLLSRRC